MNSEITCSECGGHPCKCNKCFIPALPRLIWEDKQSVLNPFKREDREKMTNREFFDFLESDEWEQDNDGNFIKKDDQ